MRILCISDLHREFDRTTCNRGGIPKYHHIDDCGADVIVIAGDLDTGVQGIIWAIEESERLGTPIVYVPGNHEYYGRTILQHTLKLKGHAVGTGVMVLDRDTVVIEGVRFLGCTLWTDFSLYGNATVAMYKARESMRDFQVIRQPPSYRKMEPIFTVEMHQNSVYWLDHELEKPFDGRTVVVTHHAPSERSISQAYEGNELNPAYASNLEALLKPPVSLWVHGHQHDSADYTIGHTRVICNPRGYYPHYLNEEFEPSKVVEI